MIGLFNKEIEMELKRKTMEYYDYYDMIDEVEKKFNIQVRDYLGKWAKDETTANPYCDYWHFLIDYIEVHNGVMVNIDFSEILESAKRNDEEDNIERPWRTEITNMILEVVGSGDKNYLISW